MKNQDGVLARIIGGSGFLGIAGLAFMVVSISYDVILRYVFYAPTFWALEVNTFLLAFLCVIPAGDVLRLGSQIRITVLYERFGPAVQARLDMLRGGAGLFFCAVMIWKGADMAWKAWEHNDRMSTSLGTPMVIPYLFLPIGFGLMGLQYLHMLAGKKKVEPESKEGAPEEKLETGQQI